MRHLRYGVLTIVLYYIVFGISIVYAVHIQYSILSIVVCYSILLYYNILQVKLQWCVWDVVYLV